MYCQLSLIFIWIIPFMDYPRMFKNQSGFCMLFRHLNCFSSKYILKEYKENWALAYISIIRKTLCSGNIFQSNTVFYITISVDLKKPVFKVLVFENNKLYYLYTKERHNYIISNPKRGNFQGNDDSNLKVVF